MAFVNDKMSAFSFFSVLKNKIMIDENELAAIWIVSQLNKVNLYPLLVRLEI